MILVLFRSRLTPEAGDDYQAMAEEMVATARNMPGFIDYTFYTSENGERLSVIEVRWESQETMKAWREHPSAIKSRKPPDATAGIRITKLKSPKSSAAQASSAPDYCLFP